MQGDTRVASLIPGDRFSMIPNPEDVSSNLAGRTKTSLPVLGIVNYQILFTLCHFKLNLYELLFANSVPYNLGCE